MEHCSICIFFDHLFYFVFRRIGENIQPGMKCWCQQKKDVGKLDWSLCIFIRAWTRRRSVMIMTPSFYFPGDAIYGSSNTPAFLRKPVDACRGDLIKGRQFRVGCECYRCSTGVFPVVFPCTYIPPECGI